MGTIHNILKQNTIVTLLSQIRHKLCNKSYISSQHLEIYASTLKGYCSNMAECDQKVGSYICQGPVLYLQLVDSLIQKAK